MDTSTTDDYSEELFTVYKTDDCLELKHVLGSAEIDYTTKTTTSPICCADSRLSLENKTTFLVKKQDLKRAVALANDTIENIRNRRSDTKLKFKTFIEKLRKIFRLS